MEDSYYYAIPKGKKTLYTDYIKLANREHTYPRDEMPVPAPCIESDTTPIWYTPNKKLYDYLIGCGYVVSRDMLKDHIAMKKQVVTLAKIEHDKMPYSEFYTISDTGGVVFMRIEIAKYLTDKYHARIVAKKKYMFIYNFTENIYELDYGTMMKTELESMFGNLIDIRESGEIMAKIWNLKERQVTEQSLHWHNKDLINFSNGVLDINSLELVDHDPKIHFFQSIIPHKYNPDAKCPNLLELLNRVFTKKGTCVEDQLEWIGFCLSPGYRFKAINIYVGRSDTGKSTFFSLLEHLVDKVNVSPVEPQDIKKEYNIAKFRGKMINIAADVGNSRISNFNVLRELSGGDIVLGREIYSAPFEFINEAKIMIGCNDMPDFDDIQASYNRVNIIHCDNVFTAEDRKNFDIDIYKTAEEMSGLINEGIRAYKNTIDRGGFIKLDSDETADKHNLMVNGFLDWQVDELDWCGDDDGSLWMTEIENNYLNWCRRMDTRAEVSGAGFTRKFRKEFRPVYYTKERRLGPAGGQKVKIFGVRFASK